MIVKDKVNCSLCLTDFNGDKFYATNNQDIANAILFALGEMTTNGIITSNFKATIDIAPCNHSMALEITVKGGE